MPSWGAVTYGVVLSGLLAAAGFALLLRERRWPVVVTAGLAAALAPLAWDLILRHTRGNFFVDAPGGYRTARRSGCDRVRARSTPRRHLPLLTAQ
jgi:hypothetical protein